MLARAIKSKEVCMPQEQKELNRLDMVVTGVINMMEKGDITPEEEEHMRKLLERKQAAAEIQAFLKESKGR